MGNSKKKSASSNKKKTKIVSEKNTEEVNSALEENVIDTTTSNYEESTEETSSVDLDNVSLEDDKQEEIEIKEEVEQTEDKEISLKTEKVVDKKKQKKIIITTVLIVLVVLILLVVYFNTLGSNSYRLKKLGYNENEVNTIISKTNQKNMNYLYKVGYAKNIPELVKLKGFKKENFNRYVDYYNKYKKVTNEDLIVIVNKGADKYNYDEFLMNVLNSKDYKQDNRDKYMTYHKNNGKASYEDVVYLINLNINKPHSDMLVMIAKEEYFIYARLDRYISYSEKNKSLSSKEVVTNVNCDIDKAFYEELVNADVNRKYLVLINKFYKLHQNYVSNNDLLELDLNYSNRYGQKLSKDVYEAFKKLVDDASKEGLSIRNNDAYRDYSSQEYTYNESVIKNGLSYADSWLARPGHSEHQTGFALDVNKKGNYDLESFIGTSEYKWMVDNAHKYGFILRYPEGKEYLTGYNFEPWHYRYVGVDAATKIKESGITFEEYYAYYVIKK